MSERTIPSGDCFAGIAEVKVEVEERLKVGVFIEILNDGGAEDCLTAPGYAMEP